MIVVADTTPLNYLVLIQQVHLLQLLYGRVRIPPAVATELNHPRTPETVRAWITSPPDWLEMRTPQTVPDDFPSVLGPGEREAIALAEETNADALLLDEWDGREEAQRRHLTVIGTLRILGAAAEHNLVDLPEAIDRLRKTSFRASGQLFDQLLARHAAWQRARSGNLKQE